MHTAFPPQCVRITPRNTLRLHPIVGTISSAHHLAARFNYNPRKGRAGVVMNRKWDGELSVVSKAGQLYSIP